MAFISGGGGSDESRPALTPHNELISQYAALAPALAPARIRRLRRWRRGLAAGQRRRAAGGARLWRAGEQQLVVRGENLLPAAITVRGQLQNFLILVHFVGVA